ncbi:MAG: reverse transcriptase family protein, partial [Planctomycetia bacterium]
GLAGGVADPADPGDPEKLTAAGLPVLCDVVQIAAALSISVPRLRWLTYHRRSAALVHYHRFTIPKKTGGVRAISAPKADLARAQRWIFHNILRHVSIREEAHGFAAGRNILTNALPHVGRKTVVNLDLKDFFPSIGFRRVKGLFRSFGYSEQAALIFALLCTEAPRTAAVVDGGKVFVAMGDRVLPQGACTSPAVTNILCRTLDKRLAGLAKAADCSYTRYADDLTFSTSGGGRVQRLIRAARKIVADEGFVENADKTRVMRNGVRQEVTGIVVNDRPTLPREERRRLRAVLHNAAKHGLESQNKSGRSDFASYLTGKVAYASMVDPSTAERWKDALKSALAAR